MNNKLIAALVVGALVVGGITYYALNRDADTGTDTQNDQTNQNPQDGTDNANAITSIKDAMSQGATLSCEYTDAEGQRTIAYIDGNKVRAAIQNPKDKNSPSNFLLLGETLYLWPAGNATTGYTVTVNEETLKRAQEQTQGAEDVDKATNTDVVGQLEQFKQNCREATVDAAQFEKPSGITFRDFSQIYR